MFIFEGEGNRDFQTEKEMKEKTQPVTRMSTRLSPEAPSTFSATYAHKFDLR